MFSLMMKIDSSTIWQVIEQGEKSSIEFKSQKPRAEQSAREFASFANKDGGVLLMGVTDDGEIIGIEESFDYEEWFSHIARNNIIPSLNITCETLSVSSKSIMAVSIPKGKDKPYQTADGKYYIRVGSTNRIVTQSELLRLFQASGSFHYDQMPVDKTGIVDLNYAKLDNYFSKYNFGFSQETPEQQEILLKNTDILSENGQVT